MTTTRRKFFSAFCLFCLQGMAQNALAQTTSTITYTTTHTTKTDTYTFYYKINSTKKILYKSDTGDYIESSNMELPNMEPADIKKSLYNAISKFLQTATNKPTQP
ncbi:hypothetical protein CQA49_06280 [Helicobacter sp. MIT 00-7814]|uniref:hypothetical protein n=1 Tax=unclassified Helicobacter TaxID=2593540 RepID=UPI000E1F8FD3|nr:MULTISPECIES: hypothetical protein [unclassified Helicobacter]RDU53662.1 hypothetical protein CQA49_06280 [Helicobacter sp. MIT 00-7814]RDU54034.1 hypothetical protein CQA37_06245 [Helicobacter sp. MIT 99-10781]